MKNFTTKARRCEDRDIAQGFREQVWVLLLLYLDSLQALNDQANPGALPSESERSHDHRADEAKERRFYHAVRAVEKEFLRVGLMKLVPIETLGITVVEILLDGETRHVHTLSLDWWRFILDQVHLPAIPTHSAL